MSVEEASFVIAGLARNCSKSIATEILRLKSAFTGAKNLSFIVIESDSSDDTVVALERLRKEVAGFSYVSLGNLRERYPRRTERLAYCRNYYLKLISEGVAAGSDVDYVVVADLDGVNSQLTAAAVRSCWDLQGWDVCTANQDGPYYDIWALRHSMWSPCDCWEQAAMIRSLGGSAYQSVFGSVYSKMIKIDKSLPWIEVDSAFGGLAIYKKTFALASAYVGLNQQGQEVCEHVEFHRTIRERGGRIFINPKLINARIVEHARYAAGFRRAVFWCRCFLKDFAKNISPDATHR
ncbi:hypothetical protein [Tepidiphilus sp. J10]|uniref:hypothetical protein n=1 Tax=Tepidiphilus sp. J10 TaxID=2502185 RepID=UPI00163D5B3C|nr:hypothetical protein [Tepidiphilus sp. J10]